MPVKVIAPGLATTVHGSLVAPHRISPATRRGDRAASSIAT